MYTLMDFFSGDYISALRGCCALKILYALEIDQGYLAHIPSGTWVPLKNLIVKIKKYGSKFSVLDSITSGPVGVSSPDFFSRRPARQQLGTVFTMPAPKNL